MENELQSLTSAVIAIWEAFVHAFNTSFPAVPPQSDRASAGLRVSYGLKRWTGPTLNDWLRSREGWPMWRLQGRAYPAKAPLVTISLCCSA